MTSGQQQDSSLFVHSRANLMGLLELNLFLQKMCKMFSENMVSLGYSFKNMWDRVGKAQFFLQ